MTKYIQFLHSRSLVVVTAIYEGFGPCRVYSFHGVLPHECKLMLIHDVRISSNFEIKYAQPWA